MAEKLTGSALRAALMRGGKEKMATAPKPDGAAAKLDRAAMWKKAIGRSDVDAGNQTIQPGADPSAAQPKAGKIDRAAFWAKALKEAQRLPPLNFEPN